MVASGLKEVDAIWLAPKRAATAVAAAAAAAGRRRPLGEAQRRLPSVAIGRRSRTLDSMLAEEDAAAAAAAEAAAEEETDEANEAVEAGIKAEIGAASALERGPPPAVFGKRKRSEVGGEEVQRCESKATTSEGAAAEGAAAAGETRPIKQPKLRNTALVNRRVRVWWGGDRQWFAGVVTSYSSRRGHQVQYDDGEIKTHWLDNSAEVQWKLDC